MDDKKKEELLKEIRKEEELCQDIYKEIIRNRILYEEEIKAVINNSEKVIKSSKVLNCSQKSDISIKKTIDIGVSPIKVISNYENSHSLKETWKINKKSPLLRNENHNLHGIKKNIRIPLENIQKNLNFDAYSSRKNPLDSLRNTSERNDMISSFDSLQYSEDLSFLK